MNKDFIESLIKMNELEVMLKGYSKVKAIAFEGNVDYEKDPVIRKMEADGWKVKDENLFGDGLSSEQLFNHSFDDWNLAASSNLVLCPLA